MCRVALNRCQLAKVPACAPRHIGASWSTTRHSRHDRHLRRALPRLGRVNARLGQTRPGAPPSPGLRVRAPGRASRPCCAPALGVLRKLRHRPDPARRIAACGPRAALEGPPAALTPTALGRYRLPLLAPPERHPSASVHRPRVCAPKRAARYCGAAQSTALRTLRAVARSTPQNRFCGQRAAVEACGFRSAFGKAGSHSQRFASVSQSAGALSPKDTARFASCSLAAVDH
ncbi:hypothetical protein GHT06_006804 [Daphnia sinensis]|uniref:Uncharacterized protein n=1 Tax=Daphnia sinensis TaxID=1820382 RepID=A0AAD5KSY9_9CRUS|nr:hypothetical protein GHT06_006804 [Daphnia sinensis]